MDRDLWTALFAHAVLSYTLLAAPLAVAATTAGPREPLFGGTLALVAPLYYVAVGGFAVAPAVLSAWGTAPSDEEAGPVAELKRQYVADDLSESEFEKHLEDELEE